MAVSEQSFLMALAGLSGSGKSTITKAIAKELSEQSDINVVILDSDPIRKDILGVAHTTRLGEDAYAWDVTKKVIAEMDHRTKDALQKGTSVLLTSILVEEAHRQAKQKLAEECGAAFIGIWLDAPTHVLLERVEKRSLQDKDASDANTEIVKKQVEAQEAVTDWPKINSHGSVEEVVSAAMKLIPEPLIQSKAECG